MPGFTIEDKGVSASLVYRLAENENVDAFSSRMLEENDIEGILPAVFGERNGFQEVRYGVASRVTFEMLLKGTLGRRELLSVFGGIIDVINRAGEYLLDISMFVMEPAYIFVNPGSYSVDMIFLPVLREQLWQINERVRILYKNTMFGARFCVEEDSRYITELINGLNGEEDFSLSEFRKLIYGQYVDSDVSYISDHNPDSGARECCATECCVNEGCGYETINSDSYISDSGKHSFIHWISEKFGMRKREQHISQDISQTVVCHDNQQDTNMHNNMLYLSDDTVLLTPSVNDMDIPYLIRSSSTERINLNKEVFRIGKDARYADYQITDNAAVSRAHAELRMDSGRCCVCDDNSLNHTYVNDTMLDSQVPYELTTGDVIRLADEEFIFYS